jgi:hypothetical protein
LIYLFRAGKPALNKSHNIRSPESEKMPYFPDVNAHSETRVLALVAKSSLQFLNFVYPTT